ncbi:MAG: hypothetical protein J4224_04735 [Candidatus Diapherotrites archaeon]|uniref:Uncharacterized protein n=1 Tax=Candidatus Iainarchaeum sp. TaxID=3101447 RepID=A0A7J4ISY1_9ARCH|nr:MAG: Ribonuclease P protein component 3 [archaeon GW2011_AR10]MBS3059700.1 hypothetical protein [Candidatus Diapherotrites archaeon]HIH07844.1 hypothetical protein [Candidatus Diapherotrites archaeon]
MDLLQFTDFGKIAAIANDLGINEIVIAKDFSEKELEELKKEIPKQKLKFFTCKVLEKTDAKALKRFRGKADFVAVKGSTVQLNKFAVASKVDFLLQPIDSGKLRFDTAIARVAMQNNVRVCFLFSEFLEAKPFQRALMLKNAFMVSKLARKFGCSLQVFSGATSEWEMRHERGLQNFLKSLEEKK